jgi:hypothetical protein
MNIKEVKEISKLLVNYVMVCENELGEDEHKNAKPISTEEHEKIIQLINKLNNLENYVDGNIFGSGSNGLPAEYEEE